MTANSPQETEAADAAERGTPFEVFATFLKLGLTSFGGPVAHIGYFRAEFVERRKWLDDAAYTDLVALCQFLPGPASSQVGIALGFGRAGWAGAMAAWAGFTLPSAFALICFALGMARWAQLGQSGAVHGLKLAAVTIVAQAVWGMKTSLCPDRLRSGIAVVAALIALEVPSALGQLSAIALGGLAGWRLLTLVHQRPVWHRRYGMSRLQGAFLLGVFFILLAFLPGVADLSGAPWLKAAAVFYRSGSLVFGGGHVVLPLLQASVVPSGWVSNDVFLAGYGAAQAVPGPLFTFAAFLGAVMPAPLGGWPGGLAMLAAIFLPAFLLVLGALPFWETLRQKDALQRAMAGVGAAVVGILGAALYDPIWTSAVHSRPDLALALVAYALLVIGRVSPVFVVALTAFGGWALAA